MKKIDHHLSQNRSDINQHLPTYLRDQLKKIEESNLCALACLLHAVHTASTTTPT